MRLNSVYVGRTSLAEKAPPADAAVAAYKGLARVEQAYRPLKTTRLDLRPLLDTWERWAWPMSHCRDFDA